MGVAIFAPQEENMDKQRKEILRLLGRYFFSQFWSEFTPQVLYEFYEDDCMYR